jgi:hypothetical protein
MYLLAKRSDTVSRPGDAPPSASTLAETYLGRDAGRLVSRQLPLALHSGELLVESGFDGSQAGLQRSDLAG